MIKLRRKFIIEDVESDYKGMYSDIERETFDKIIALDPTARGNKIGSFAQGLLLRCYKAGETGFLDKGPEVIQAIQKFLRDIRPNKDLDGKYKNPNNYKSVEDFIKFVNDPTQEIETGNPSEGPQLTKLDILYNKYYKDKLPKDQFEDIIRLDSTTTSSSIGDIAKLLLLPKFIQLTDSERANLLNNKLSLIKACSNYWKYKDHLPDEYKDLSKIASIEDFIDVTNGNKSPDSSLVNYLKSLGNVIWRECNYLGSTWKHDLFEPTTRRAAAYIAGADNSSSMPGYSRSPSRYGPGIGSNGSRDYTENLYGHWCTTQGSYWDNYRGRDGSAKYFDFMAKGSDLWENGRKRNYQIAVEQSGRVNSAADGYEDYQHAEIMLPRLISEDPDVLELCTKLSNSNISRTSEVQSYTVVKEYSNKPFIFSSMDDITNGLKGKLSEDGYKLAIQLIPELVISEGVELIPTGTFTGWTGLKKITFPKSLKRIGVEAFKGCIGLTLIELPAELEHIGGQAFANCIGLRGTIRIPKTCNYIGRNAFYDTEVTAFSVPDNTQDGYISIDPKDLGLYSKKAKLIKTSEAIEEELNEDLLDENLPRDLAYAYSKTGQSRQYWPGTTLSHTHPGNAGSSRRMVKYDYKNSTYRVITSDEAKRLLKADRANAKYLRFIKDGKLIEFINNREGEVHPIFGAYVSITLPSGVTKDARQCTMNQIVDNVDKIYWTDEYQHPLSDDVIQQRIDKAIEKETGLFGLERKKNPDTGNHERQLDRDVIIKSPNTPLVDIGDIQDTQLMTAFNSYVTEYPRFIAEKKALHRLRVIIDNLKKNESDYSEEEFEELLSNIKNQYNDRKSAYDEKLQSMNNAKATFDKLFDQLFIQEYSAKREKVAELAAKIKEKEAELQAAENELKLFRTKNVTDSDEYKKLMTSVDTMENELKKLTSSIGTLQTEEENLLRKIAELEKQLQANRVEREHMTAILGSRSETLEKMRVGLEDSIEQLSDDMSSKIDDLQSKVNDIKKWFNDNPDSGKRFDLEKEAPAMNPELAKKFSLRDKKEVEDDPGISYDIPDTMDEWSERVFKLPFNLVRAIFRVNLKKRSVYSEEVYTVSGERLYNPFFDSFMNSDGSVRLKDMYQWFMTNCNMTPHETDNELYWWLRHIKRYNQNTWINADYTLNTDYIERNYGTEYLDNLMSDTNY